MTDKEIIKAFKDTINTLSKRDCLIIPKDGIENLCIGLKGVFDLINRQQAEIERLQTENNQFADIGKMYSEIRAEAIKEFAERLKEHLKGNGGLYCVTTMNAKIDILVKEMAGEQE